MPYSYDEDTIREVRERNDIVDIISQYVELKRAGSNYKGLCPFHNEKTPSMVVSPDKQMFHCFGCGEGGDVISFLSKYKSMDFQDVIVELAERANVELKQKTDEDIEREKKLKLLYDINREAAIYFYKVLRSSPEAENYFLERGINSDTIKRFGLGYSRGSWSLLLQYLKQKGYSELDIEEAGLAIRHREKQSYYDRFRSRVMFPIWDISSRVIGFGGRLIEPAENQPKYLNSPDTPVFLKGRNLYGLNIIKESIRGGRILLVEGYMDVISLYQSGIKNATASLGTALTRDQIRLIKRYTGDIAIAYDSDEAGIKATKKAIEIIRSEKLTPRVVEMDEGLDPDDYVKKYGSEKFRLKMENAIHYIDFIINLNKKKYDLSLIEDKLKFIADIAYWLKMIESPVELELYLVKVASEVGVPVDTVRGELRLKKGAFERSRLEINPVKAGSTKRDGSIDSSVQTEMELLSLVLNSKTDLGKLNLNISAEDFKDNLNRAIAIELLRLEPEAQLDNGFKREDIEARTVEIKSLELFLEDNQREKALNDYARKLKIQSLKRKKRHIMDKIKEIESGSSDKSISKEDFNSLCRELTEIDRDIKLL
ncbi:DNA primase [Andreesenia angusta]|uniref:DNA primase n=1 Tax=Andreesenia angusta TaxID=39480 RepID=A0A1S1V7N7_9FIRM|nr:DNA primase [Andreesenia angusta]OHW62572.1 DNA primase [Andreesenia angusta]